MLSKKIILAIIVFILIISSALFWNKYQKNKTDQQAYNDTLNAIKKNPKLYIDTDGDGLKDWEEILWKTDLNNPDTDGDGTNDFEEIRAGRDPNKKGPDDLLPKEDLKTKVNNNIESDLTETDKFSRMFMAQYIASKNKGDYKRGNYNQLLQYLIKPTSTTTLITPREIFAVESSTVNIKQYGNDLGRIITEAKEKYPASELVELEKAKNNPKNFNIENIKEASQRYRYLADQFKEIKVPNELITQHLKIINILNTISQSVASMEFYISDPVKSLTEISLYPDGISLLNNIFIDLNNYFKKKNIKFSTNEYGYNFFNGL